MEVPGGFMNPENRGFLPHQCLDISHLPPSHAQSTTFPLWGVSRASSAPERHKIKPSVPEHQSWAEGSWALLRAACVQLKHISRNASLLDLEAQ